MSKFNINGLTDTQQQSCMSFMITNAERLSILAARGQRMTGYPIQLRPGSDNKVYFWPMGKQPEPELIASIGDKNPIRAAEKFLSIYFAKSELKPATQTGEPFMRPKAQAEAEKSKSTNPEKVIELSLCSFDEFLPESGKVYKFIKHEGCLHCAQADMLMGLARRAQG